jgi:hypothetical protein
MYIHNEIQIKKTPIMIFTTQTNLAFFLLVSNTGLNRVDNVKKNVLQRSGLHSEARKLVEAGGL